MRPFRILALLALAVLASRPAAAQEPGAVVSGVVTDSLAGKPLADAAVQLVPAGAQAPVARTVMSDAQGRFAFAGVPDGSYLIGFLHPLLETLGLEPIARSVTVSGGQPVRADLATPSPARLKAAYCDGDGTGAVVMGFVRTARGEPAEGASVLGEWLELAIRRGGVSQQTARRTATTAANGGFILCGLPNAGTVLLQVSRGAETTDRVETEIPAAGFVHRDLYLGQAVAAARPDSALRDSIPAPRARTGEGRLSGTVIGAVGRPLANAQVSVMHSAPVRANEQGEWTLSGVPTGTRLVEVRATGYYPVQRVVDIVDGAPPLRVTLTRLATVLDTLRVVARSASMLRSGFMERRSTSATGRFLSADDIEKRNMVEIADLFDFTPGLYRDRADDSVTMRSTFGDRCVPAIYYNGMKLRGLSMSDVNLLAPVDAVGGIEVYMDSHIPPQFQDPMSGCGSIVIWTK